jgi:phenylalanyl-tRNA synthetase alpha chain
MKEVIEKIKKNAIEELNNVVDKETIESIRVKYLGKKGELTKILRGMGGLSPEERPIVGKLANEVRKNIEEIIEVSLKEIKEKEKKY